MTRVDYFKRKVYYCSTLLIALKPYSEMGAYHIISHLGWALIRGVRLFEALRYCYRLELKHNRKVIGWQSMSVITYRNASNKRTPRISAHPKCEII